MNEKPSPFCDPNCLFNGVPKMCDTDCMHSQDIVFEKPKKIQIRYQGNWILADCLGESMGKYYIRTPDGAVMTTYKTSPLIR